MNKHIDNIIKSIGRHKKGLSDPRIMHPERDWGIGLFLALLVFVSSGAWSLALYIENRTALVDPMLEEQSEPVVYRESMVEEALTRLNERTAKLESLIPPADAIVPPEPVEVAREVADVAASTTEPVEQISEEVPVLDEGSLRLE